MMPDKLLNTLANFEQWRSNKPSRGSAIPENLRQQAIALLSHYSKTTIVKKLRISHEQFNTWLTANSSNDVSNHFISLPNTTPITELLSIDLKFNNGNSLAVSGEVSQTRFTQLIEAIKS
ncbi:hypothetical protein NM432_18475 (plasmid) [Vibrio metschnikovii]|nr:hypothetical protein [Vibrio metschnikovii]EKO3643827.1 hypothetical protein [Vibrio metschnikovii]EKO3667641.1 hypothetical protein [Vibrio metschnikovii]EKO3878134.1 hypothetical protein [Vibrio metschnikovii]